MDVNKYRIVMALVIAIAVFFFLIQNLIIPFFTDDYAFMYFRGERIETVGKMIECTYNQYFTLNARLWCQIFSISMSALLGDFIFNIINSTLFCAVILLCIRYINIWIPHTLAIIVLIIGFFSISDNSNQLFYWACGSGNYLLSIFFALIIMLVEKKYRDGHNAKYPLLLFPSIFICSLINEAILIPMCISYFLYYAYRYKSLTKTQISILFGLFIGTSFVVFCPGTLGRAGRSGEELGFVEILKRFVSVFVSLKMFYVFIITLLLGYFRKQEYTKNFIKENPLLILLIITGMIPALLAGGKGRVLIACEVYSIFALAVYFKNFTTKKANSLAVLLFCCFIVWESFVTYDSYKVWGGYKKVTNEYIDKKGNIVEWDDSYKPTIAGSLYVVDPISLFETKGTTERLAKIKSDKLNVDSVDYLTVLPQSIIHSIQNGLLNDQKNKVKATEKFYTSDEISFYVANYDSTLWAKIKEGCYTVKYHFDLYPSLKLYTNFSKGDVNDAMCPATIINGGPLQDIILINKSYKHYFGFTFDSIIIEEKEPNKKFILKKE